MLLAVDVGNTETKVGLFADGSAALAHRWRIRTVPDRTADEYAVALHALFARDAVPPSCVAATVVASVVPQADEEVRAALRTAFGPEPRFFVAAEQRSLPIRTEHPREVGADMAAAALGARERYGTPLIVVGFGTATTFAAVDRSGAFVGAAIAPGIRISVDALVDRAAKLRRVGLAPPLRAIGRDTVAALQSGIVFGFVAQAEGMIARFDDELGGGATVVATGGLAAVVCEQTTRIHAIEPHLVLEGLHRWYRLREAALPAESASEPPRAG